MKAIAHNDPGACLRRVTPIFAEGDSISLTGRTFSKADLARWVREGNAEMLPSPLDVPTGSVLWSDKDGWVKVHTEEGLRALSKVCMSLANGRLRDGDTAGASEMCDVAIAAHPCTEAEAVGLKKMIHSGNPEILRVLENIEREIR